MVLIIRNVLVLLYQSDSVLVIIDAKPKDLGLPTEAYIAVEEIHNVIIVRCLRQTDFSEYVYFISRMVVQHRKHLNIYHQKSVQKKLKKWVLSIS